MIFETSFDDSIMFIIQPTQELSSNCREEEKVP